MGVTCSINKYFTRYINEVTICDNNESELTVKVVNLVKNCIDRFIL